MSRLIILAAAALALAVETGRAEPAQQDTFKNPAADTVGKQAPELLAAGWVGSPVSLRAVKGNPVVLTFWNCDTNYFDSPEYFLKDVMSDYNKYEKSRNITFVSICMSMTATLKQVEKYADQYKVHPLPTMLDAGGATSHAYKVPKNYFSWVVVIDAEGKIVYTRNKGWYYINADGSHTLVHHREIENCLKTAPGILGRKTVPTGGEAAAKMFEMQQFQLAEFEIKKADARKPSDELKEFTGYLSGKIADTRKQRLAEAQELAKTSPVQAYREAVAFVAAFPSSPERSPMNDLGKSLIQDPKVKKELQAEDAYRRILVPELVKTPKGTAEFAARVQPALDAFNKVYGDTQYAAAVTDGVEGYKMAAGRSR